jgi:hypothetical protein
MDLPGLDSASFPSLTIVVPACNEADSIEQGMISLLALDYPLFEIIAVDDRSTDGTGEILDRLAARHPLLKVVHIQELPAGWLGKNHALQMASEQAMGDWLLFTDADVVLRPDAMRRAVAYADAHRVHHLVLSPRCSTQGFWERLFVSYFGIIFSFRVQPWNIADPTKPSYVGLGAFNMIRTSAYREIGGHAALRMDVTDDMKLGKLVKRAGLRQHLLDGGDLVSVRWVVGLRGIIEGLTKNAYAAFEYRLGGAAAGAVALALMSAFPIAGLFVPVLTCRICSALALAEMMWAAGFMRRLTGARAIYGLAYPVASVLMIYILLRSAWRAHRNRGILWRGTLYPLEELKRGVV